MTDTEPPPGSSAARSLICSPAPATTGRPASDPIAAVLATLKLTSAYIDGEIAVVTDEGISVYFGALQEALGRHGGSTEMVYVAFDILHLDGRDCAPCP